MTESEYGGSSALRRVGGAVLRRDAVDVGDRLVGALADVERAFVADRARAEDRVRNERLVIVDDLDQHDRGARARGDLVPGRADRLQRGIVLARALRPVIGGDDLGAVAALPADPLASACA